MSDNPLKDKAKAAPEVYKYYSTQRPVDIGTFPKTDSGPTEIVNFDKRENVENGGFQAWGYLLYHTPLTEKQIDDYELRAVPGNPDTQLSERYEKGKESKFRTEKKPIAERLKEGAAQAEKDNAARPAPAKNTEKDR